jgi:hypothetical protein
MCISITVLAQIFPPKIVSKILKRSCPPKMFITNRELREEYLGYHKRGDFMTYVTQLLLQEECRLERCHCPDFWNTSTGACKFLLETPFKKQSEKEGKFYTASQNVSRHL